MEQNKKYISTPGEYVGYSEAKYDGYKRISQYYTVSDGTHLAVDIYRPTLNGVLHEEKLPVIWTATQYQRAKVRADGSYTDLRDNPFFCPKAEDLVKHGYVLAVLDVRGTGSSFGTRGTMHTYRDMWDLREVNEWLASHEWCTGKTGMFGLSFLARTQYLAAISRAPSLKCIFPEVGGLCQPQLTSNGVGNISQFASVDALQKYNNIEHPAPPVDEDVDGSLLRAAIEDHKNNPSFVEDRLSVPFTDSWSKKWGTRIFMDFPLEKGIIDVNNSDIAVCIWDGWNDFFAQDAFQWYSSLTVPKRFVMGNWIHGGEIMATGEMDWLTEHLRWYDYWLKGIDNGIMDEPSVWFYHIGKKRWITYEDSQFPLSVEKSIKYYINSEKAESIDSVNDGSLDTLKVTRGKDRDEYPIDYTVTKTGYQSRFQLAEWATASTDYSGLDSKSLTYTSEVLAQDLELIGSPVADLWVSATADIVDFYIYLEDVSEDGVSKLLSEGYMRTANRKMATPIFNNMGLPYHTNYEADQLPLPKNGEPVELLFAMMPLCNTIPAGHRIRVTINNFDKNNWDTPELTPAPTVSVYHSTQYSSCVILPTVK